MASGGSVGLLPKDCAAAGPTMKSPAMLGCQEVLDNWMRIVNAMVHDIYHLSNVVRGLFRAIGSAWDMSLNCQVAWRM